jgi:2-iminobutanoate/2-iminopropanoate deaminase
MSRPSPAVPHSFVRSAVRSLFALSLMGAAPLGAQAVREPVIPAGQSATATLTPGIKIGNLVFASGQLGMSREAPDTTVGGQTRIALENTKKVFEAAGTTMAHAAKCTVFLIDVKDFGAMNQAYRAFFPDSPPARSTVVVAALVVPNAKVEIECMAVMPAK